MPPKGRAGGGARKKEAPKNDVEVSVDIALGEIDLAMDEYRHSLDRKLDSTVSAMTSLVEATLLRMPARIKHMSMKEFMLEFEGNAALVLERDRKMSRIARTVAKGSAYGSRLGTVLKPASRTSRLATLADTDTDDAAAAAPAATEPAAKMARIGATTCVAASATALAAASHAMATGAGHAVAPIAAGRLLPPSSSAATTPAVFRSRALTSAAASTAAAVATPKMKSMLSSAVPATLSSATPMINRMLPKTPAAGMRRPRRGEVFYLVSANGSPLGGTENASASSDARVSMATTAGGVPAAAPASSLADVELVLNDGAVVADEEAAMRFAAENGADALLSTIEAMQAKLEALKAAAARGTALASASAATAVSGA